MKIHGSNLEISSGNTQPEPNWRTATCGQCGWHAPFLCRKPHMMHKAHLDSKACRDYEPRADMACQPDAKKLAWRLREIENMAHNHVPDEEWNRAITAALREAICELLPQEPRDE